MNKYSLGDLVIVEALTDDQEPTWTWALGTITAIDNNIAEYQPWISTSNPESLNKEKAIAEERRKLQKLEEEYHEQCETVQRHKELEERTVAAKKELDQAKNLLSQVSDTTLVEMSNTTSTSGKQILLFRFFTTNRNWLGKTCQTTWRMYPMSAIVSGHLIP